MQLELRFDSRVKLQADGSYVVTPGRLVARKAEDWRYLRDVSEQMPYRCRHENVLLLKTGEVRGRQRKKRGWWEVEKNSLRPGISTQHQPAFTLQPKNPVG